jgi:hypothetical protein
MESSEVWNLGENVVGGLGWVMKPGQRKRVWKHYKFSFKVQGIHSTIRANITTLYSFS